MESNEFLQDFIIEAKEHLESIEPNIVRLEKYPEEQSAILNEIFRPMHSLKGASGFLGLEKINTLAHKAESVMDELRKGNMKLNSTITDAILSATEVLGAIVEHVEQYAEEGDIDIDPIVEKLSAILNNEEVQDDILQEKVKQLDAVDNELNTMLDILSESGLACLQSSSDEDITKLLNTLATIIELTEQTEFEDVNHAAQHTMDIIEQTKSKGLEYAPLLPILEQEIAIIVDLGKEILKKEDVREHCIKALEQVLQVFVEDAGHTIDVLYEVLIATKEYTDEHGLSDIKHLLENTLTLIKQTQDMQADINPLVPILSQEISIIISLLKNHTEVETVKEAEQKESIIKKEAVPEKNTSPSVNKEQPTTTSKEQIRHSTFIRVDHHRLDQLMNLIGELIITRNRYTLLVRSLESGEQTKENITQIAQDLTETTSLMARISDALQDTIMQVRMVSLSATFSRLPRLVRDISKKSGKNVELHIIGEETELDKNMVEALSDPLLHLIRNAVDHGIESPQEREEKRKSPTGNVWIRAFHKGNSVVVEIEDDGKGMNPEVLKEIALEKGLIQHEEAKFMSDEQAYDLIFYPGFSSAKEITDISGRGVGMDVVRTNIKNLKGSIAITSEMGVGTIFTLTFPLTLAIIEALMVEIHNQVFAIPLDTVLETTKISKTHIKRVQDTEAITLRGEVLSIIHLADKLGFESERTLPDIISVVIVTINNKKVGLVVDKLLERQEIVIKSLGKYPIASTGISGATITGNGGVILIINPHELYTVANKKLER